ncbi:hypothetical protein STEG23_024447, partial [Scotinomys teguina]
SVICYIPKLWRIEETILNPTADFRKNSLVFLYLQQRHIQVCSPEQFSKTVFRIVLQSLQRSKAMPPMLWSGWLLHWAVGDPTLSSKDPIREKPLRMLHSKTFKAAGFSIDCSVLYSKGIKCSQGGGNSSVETDETPDLLWNSHSLLWVACGKCPSFYGQMRITKQKPDAATYIRIPSSPEDPVSLQVPDALLSEDIVVDSTANPSWRSRVFPFLSQRPVNSVTVQRPDEPSLYAFCDSVHRITEKKRQLAPANA